MKQSSSHLDLCSTSTKTDQPHITEAVAEQSCSSLQHYYAFTVWARTPNCSTTRTKVALSLASVELVSYTLAITQPVKRSHYVRVRRVVTFATVFAGRSPRLEQYYSRTASLGRSRRKVATALATDPTPTSIRTVLGGGGSRTSCDSV